jgi:L-fuconolactonase
MIVDSHQHFWQVGRFDYPWMRSEVEVLYRDYLPEELEPVLRANSVESTVLVQASNSLAESRWLLELADKHPFIAGVVGWVDLAHPEVDRQLDELVSDKFKGVRHLVESEPDDEWLLRPAVINGLRRLAARNLTYDLLIHPRHLGYAERLVKEVPSLNFVIDHMAKPAIAKGEFESWAKQLEPFKDLQNVYCKMSGLVTEANWSSWTTGDLRPYVDHALSVFGTDRLMFGSDHPVCLLAGSYDRVLDAFQELIKESDKIFRDNAAKFYSLRLCG